MSSQHHEGGSGHYIAPLSMYFATFGALLVLTFLTVAVTYVDLGRFNIIIALGIAVVKAGLVSLFFMGLIHDDRFNAVVFGGALLFLSLFFIFTFPDILYRSVIDPVEGNPGSNPSAYGYVMPEAAGGETVKDGHVNPKFTPKRLYGGATSTGTSSGTSGVIVLESAGRFLPGGSQYGVTEQSPKAESHGAEAEH